MPSSCILGFQATRVETWTHFYSSSVYCTLANRKIISEANNQGLQTQQCPTGQEAGNPCRGRFNTERTVT